MLFNSISFLFFFIVVTGLYFNLPHKYRWLLLLLSSCYFYMFFLPIYILILGFTIVIDYWAGIWIEQSVGRRRKIFLICSIVANVGVLAIFKYYNFFVGNISLLLEPFGIVNRLPYLTILLPIGLSFHTFQAMSYTIEVFRGNQSAERHFGIYALYVMFYPQLVAGPIERPQNILHQLKEQHQFSYLRVTDGLKLMTWGLFKKIAIADRLALVVDPVFDNPNSHDGITIALAAIFFSFQIYCDFSGYSDIAIGAAQVMGFSLMTNFRAPYLSRSISEFWTRWHISLSTWFRDYLYVPLGGNRVSERRWASNILIVFLISGVWHGANWTYIVWGGLHGLFVICERIWSRAVKLLPNDEKRNFRPLALLFTFLMVTFAWVFFRAKNLNDSLLLISKLGTGWSNVLDPAYLINWNLRIGVDKSALLIGILLIVFLVLVEYVQVSYGSIRSILSKQKAVLRWSVYYAAILALLVLRVNSEKQFIYFQF